MINTDFNVHFLLVPKSFSFPKLILVIQKWDLYHIGEFQSSLCIMTPKLWPYMVGGRCSGFLFVIYIANGSRNAGRYNPYSSLIQV